MSYDHAEMVQAIIARERRYEMTKLGDKLRAMARRIDQQGLALEAQGDRELADELERGAAEYRRIALVADRRCPTCGALPEENCRLPVTQNCLHPKADRQTPEDVIRERIAEGIDPLEGSDL